MGTLFILQGTIVNTIAIIVGTAIGVMLPTIPDQYKKTVMQAIGLAVIVIGIDMAMGTQNVLVMIISAVIGGLLGEMLRIEDRLDQFGIKVERLFVRKKDGVSDGKIAKGFIFATLIYCVGSMAIVGALESGLQYKHDVLYTKSMLDGFSAIIFASTMGIGVMLSAASVFIYQGVIALGASSLADYLHEGVIFEIRAVGGLLIMGIGLNLLEIKNVRVANMLPSIFIAGIIMIILSMFMSLQQSEMILEEKFMEIKDVYGVTITYEEIVDVELRDKMPTIEQRTNGSSAGNMRKGNFRLEEVGDAKLYVTVNNPPYVVITTDSKAVYFNDKEPDRTRDLYRQLQEKIGKQ